MRSYLCVAQASHELNTLLTFASQVLCLQGCATMASSNEPISAWLGVLGQIPFLPLSSIVLKMRVEPGRNSLRVL